MLMKLRSRMQNQKGFTLVELMVVVVILGILVAIAVPVYNNVTTNAERSAVMANLRTIDGAIMSYYTDASHTGAVDIATLVADGYIQAAPEGPKSAAYSITAAEPYTATVSGAVAGVTLPAGTSLAALKSPTGSYKW